MPRAPVIAPLVSLPDRLLLRACAAPHEEVYAFEDAHGIARVTADALAREVFGLAEALSGVGIPGDRVLVAVSPGLAYAVAVLACFAAGRVAVPAFPPRSRRLIAQFEAICRDAGPALVLCDPRADWAQTVDAGAPVEPVRLGARAFPDVLPPAPAPEDLAFLQYTSGSTGQPKGVMVTHAALMANLERQRALYDIRPGDRGVIWLPPYHDMGLGSGLLQPLYSRSQVRLMSPAYAMQRPLRWLEAISQTRAAISGGPPSAFAACAVAATRHPPAGLNLSSWRCAFVGAEPVARKTLEAFAAAFASSGFRRDAFQPSYGLAEATLLVSGVEPGGDWAESDHPHRANCGRVSPDHEVRIVEPATCRARADGREGEIWIRGPSVAAGYWNDPETTAATFGARLATGEGPWLRTGDLGVLCKGRLTVTGRIKDLMIFAGRKIHAADVEATVREAAGLEPAYPGVAAVAVPGEIGDRLAVLLEWRAARDDGAGEALRRAIVSAVSRDHAVGLYALRLLPLGTLPRTTSGKIRRANCRILAQEAAA